MSDTYVLTLDGCEVPLHVELVLTDAEAAAINKAAEAVTQAALGYQPRMSLTRGLLIDGELVKDGAE